MVKSPLTNVLLLNKNDFFRRKIFLVRHYIHINSVLLHFFLSLCFDMYPRAAGACLGGGRQKPDKADFYSRAAGAVRRKTVRHWGILSFFKQALNPP